MGSINNDEILKAVRRHYAGRAKQSNRNSCCTSHSPCCATTSKSKDSEIFAYSEEEISHILEEALMGLGCGNPGAIAAIKSGETVLDLGSGGGIDCFLAAKKVGDSGHVIGVDMTPEMVSQARNNIMKHGYKNIEFRLGEIENLPVADESVDVIISNCVINLSPDKPRVFSEVFRILRPGGRFSIADMIATAPLPEKIKNDLTLYVGCIAGAVFIDDLKNMLSKAGFDEIKIRFNGDRRKSTSDCATGTNLEAFVESAMVQAIKKTTVNLKKQQ